MTTRCHHHMEADPETFPWHMLASTRQGCHFCRRCFVREEAILCEQIDLRIFGRPETLAIEDEKALKTFLCSSLTNQVLSSPNKSMLIAELIKSYAHQKTGRILSSVT